ncbi:Metallo-beta-lactamase superfamily protein [Vibrio celticus]|uniref:Metallo-beta-lactamase superfamily protein n=1 Tax=Vibrio celticus TaxID=446372 RepID=A0A1C3JAI6_9VIBR|nr:Metallo-beta-lactamase superfamily protein [Vibrio celticus]
MPLWRLEPSAVKVARWVLRETALGNKCRPPDKGERIQVVSKTGDSLAYTEESDHVHPILTKHGRKMDQAIIKVDDNVYLGYGFGLDTPVMIEGTDGIIIVDPGESVEMAQSVKEQFRQITDKPVKAIIYSHNHIDHISGVRAWVTDEEVASGEVKIIA